MIICWHIENNKLYFGKVTRRSWHRAIRGKCGYLLEVKPLKGFEKFNYYPDCVMVELQDAHLTNWIVDTIPLTLRRCLEKEGYHLNIETWELTPLPIARGMITPEEYADYYNEAIAQNTKFWKREEEENENTQLSYNG
jgi:hypothetical protein